MDCQIIQDHKFKISEGPSGIDELTENASISVYPNPFSNETSIAYELKSKMAVDAAIVIVDVTGKVVSRVALTQAKGSVQVNPILNNGIYFVRIINGAEVIAPVKILKMK
jgi:hypothetical protein